MAMTFNSREAQDLIRKHEQLLKKLRSISDLPNKLRRETESTIEKLEKQNTFTNMVERSVLFQDDIQEKSPGSEILVSNLYKYQRLLPAAESTQQLIAFNADNIEKDIVALRKGGTGLRRVFSSSKKKEASEHAYQSLQSLLNSAYFDSAQRTFDTVESINNTPSSEQWDDFHSDKKRYQRLLFYSVLPQLYAQKGSIPFISKLIQEQESLKERASEYGKGLEIEIDSIRVSVERQLSSEVLELLKNVPVEEVNRERGGIRVKALRDYGYASMADLYTASSYQLSSVRGISEQTAYEIKRAATDFAKRTQNAAKIKLNADNRTKESTALIRSVRRFINIEQGIKELDAVEKEFGAQISQSKKALSDVGNGLLWLFYNKDERESVRDAFHLLSELMEGDYAQRIRQVTSSTEGPIFSDQEAWNHFSENTVKYYNVIESVVPGALGNDDKLYGLPEELAKEIQEESFFPDGLLCTLRRYQEWGVKYILHQERVLLGDEMGLGKTIQAIATMVSLRNVGATHFIVVCPASVIANWCREVTKQSKLRVTKIHGYSRMDALASWKKTGGVAVTTYETTPHIHLDENDHLDLVVVDEAHYIKNPNAARSKNVKELCSHTKRLLFMTGTALENKVDEMISLIKVLRPQEASRLQSVAFLSSAPEFRQMVAPMYYRRKREDVLTELPDKIETKEWCTLFGEEKRRYEESVLSKNYADVRRVSWNIEDIENSSKAKRLKELVIEAEEEERKVIVFSFFLDTIQKVGTLLGERCYGPINGSVPPARRQDIIDEFDKAPAGSVLIAQIQSGGTGLNIQSASMVIICEPQFKPSIENQAISRAYRMGQSRNVLVYRLLCENTVDERISELLEQKQAIFDAFADESVAAAESTELDQQTFGQIIEEEIERIKASRNEDSK